MSIQSRLILALSSLALALVLGIVLLFQWRFDLGMADYLNAQQTLRLQQLAGELSEMWEEDPGWAALRAEPKKFFRMARRLPGQEPPRREAASQHRAPHNAEPHNAHPQNPAPHNAPPPNPPPHGTAPPLPVVLLDRDGQVLIAREGFSDTLALKIAVQVDGKTVGFVGSPSLAPIENAIDRHFREAQLRSLWGVSGFALLVAVVIAVLLARHFTRPLRQLSVAAHRLTLQQYAIDVDDARRDEFGALARDMRELAATLSRNADARARWFADISHELRTPLAVLLGEIDALVDGVRPLTLERIGSLQQEVQHLRRLVDDLYVLARADLGALQYRKTAVDFAELAGERVDAAAAAIAAAGLTVQRQLPEPGPVVLGDADRLQQLIDNLLTNCVRYTAPGGEVRVAVSAHAHGALLVVEDSAPGVPDAALPRLFEHLYRVDDARTRSAGGAGLGLAICRRIVEAHGGTIAASHSALGGVRIAVTLPLSPPNPPPSSGGNE